MKTMAVEDEMSSFLFRLPTSLKEELEQKAAENHKSISAQLRDIVRDALHKDESGSLEVRTFLGQEIDLSSIDEENGLVYVNGIYYRYLIEGNHKKENVQKYIVIEANGNILTLRPLT